MRTGQSVMVEDAYANPRINTRIGLQTGDVTQDYPYVPLRTVRADVVGEAQALNKLAVPSPNMTAYC